MLLNSKNINLVVVFLIATILALWKFSDVLFEPLLCLTNQGDGSGALGQFALARPLVQEIGLFNYLFSDINPNPLWGAGLMPPNVSTVFWKSIILFLSELGLSPDNIWDFIAFSSFILTIVAGYLLALELGAPFFLAFVSGLFFAHLDVFEERIGGHLFLATYFLSIFQVLLAIKSGKNPSLKNLVVLALLSALCFAQNEYYGYLGLIFSIIVFSGYLLCYNADELKDIHRIFILIKNVLISGFVFLMSMILIYPSYIGGRLVSLFGGSQSNFSYLDHDINEVFAYGVNQPFGLFKPSFVNWQFSNPSEFTFRIGLFILLSIVIMIFVVFYFRFIKIISENPYKTYHQMMIFFLSAIVMALIGLSPNYGFSLALFSFKIAATFRVLARSYLFVDFAIIAMFVIISSFLWNNLPKNYFKNKLLIIIACCLFSFVDLSRSFLPKKAVAQHLPQQSLVFNVLKEKPYGWLLELPFYTSQQIPELSYIYFYNYSIHGKPIVNGAFHLLPKTDPEINKKIIIASGEINRPSEETIKKLGQSGVRYLTVHNDILDYSYLDSYLSIRKIDQNNNISLYEILDVNLSGKFVDYLSLFNECCTDLPIPNKKIKIPSISAGSCKSKIKILDKTNEIKAKSYGFRVFEVEVSNLGNMTWGQGGPDILLGLVWFNADKTDGGHEPNYGEQRFPIPKSLKPSESVKFNIMVNTHKKPGQYQLWLSPMQPDVMWCFHVGDTPEKLNIEVEK